MLLKEKMQAADGRPSGFDYLRLILASCVIGVHSVSIIYGVPYWHEFWFTWWRFPFASMVLPMFFALSGFLVAGSLLRSKRLLTFLGLRVLRIFPALVVEVVMCALILGPAFTTFSLPDYFSNTLFYRYFYNMLGNVQFHLPGTFTSNPNPGVVNGQLWTIPWELRCYILTAAMSITAIFYNRNYLLFFTCIFNVVAFICIRLPDSSGMVLIDSYLAGVVLFAFSDKVRHDGRLFLLSFLAAIGFLSTPFGIYFASFPVAYVAVYLGLLNPRRNKILLSGDYSYGIFLYGYPIQQAVAYVTGIHRNWSLDMALVIPIVVTVAAMSWWLVEKPALSLRKYLQVARRVDTPT